MGCEDLSRYVLIIFNIIFFLFGAAALGLGIWSLVDNTYIIKLTSYADVDSSVNVPSLLQNSAYILIAVGAFIFIISFAGCCGAWKKVKFLLVIYSILVGIIVVIEIGGIVTGYFFIDKVETELKTFLKKTITKYDSSLKPSAALQQFDYVVGEDNTYSLAWDFVQVQFECCGVDNATDYELATNWNRSLTYLDTSSVSHTVNLTYAVTCCAFENTASIADALKANKDSTLKLVNSSCAIYDPPAAYGNIDTGCLSAIKSSITKYSTPIIAIGGAILGIEIILIILAACIVRCIKSSEEIA